LSTFDVWEFLASYGQASNEGENCGVHIVMPLRWMIIVQTIEIEQTTTNLAKTIRI